MRATTREERLARQERDDGDGDDTVVLAVGERHTANVTVYHEDADCSRLHECETRETTREAAQRRWLAPCLCCVLDAREVER